MGAKTQPPRQSAYLPRGAKRLLGDGKVDGKRGIPAEQRLASQVLATQETIEWAIMPVFRNRLMAEIGPEDLRNLCAKVKARGAPATAVHVRDIVKQVFGFAALHGEKAPNPADEVGPSSIATFVAKDRALSPSEIRVMHRVLDATATLPTIRLALRLILLTLMRKSELIEATWDEVDFENAVWTIPKSRMKAGKPHNVYACQRGRVTADRRGGRSITKAVMARQTPMSIERVDVRMCDD